MVLIGCGLKKGRLYTELTRWFFYKTGGLGEYLVLGLMICLLVIEIRLLWIGQLDRLLAGKYLTNLQTWLFSLDQFLPFIK
ncbi:hypothetical protein ACFSF7_04690 [Ligilactobacillus acidipiscis]|uniref:hypothetical protein n=1 Tax=Ligilactobacillus acidipiscis TaxID=89059 RepID=UPI003629F298